MEVKLAKPIKFILLTTILTCTKLQSFSQPIDYKNNPNYKGIISPTPQQTKLTIGGEKYPLIVADSILQTIFLDGYSIYQLEVKKSGFYSIYSLCDSISVNFLLLSRDSVILTEWDKSRSYRNTLYTFLDSKKFYYIVFFTRGGIAPIIDFTFCENSLEILSSLKSKKIDESVKIKQILFERESVYYEGKKSDIFDISALFDKNKYVRVTVKGDFVPIILGLNKRDEKIKTDLGNVNDKSVSMVFTDKDSISKICIQAYYSSSIKYDSLATFHYSLEVEAFSYDPNRSWLSSFKSWFHDPLFSFAIGMVLTIIVSYFFFRKGQVRKLLTYKELADSLIVNENPEDSKATPIIVEENKLYKACLYRIKFANIGNTRIEKSYIKEPILVTFNNLLKIIDLKTSASGDGWGSIKIISDNQVHIDFDFIDAKDSIEVKIIGEFGENYHRKGIVPVVKGRIAEVLIREDIDKKNIFLDSTFFGFILFFWVLLLPILLLQYLSIPVPKFLLRTSSLIYNIGFAFIIIYFFATKSGRKSIVAMWRAFRYSLKKLFS